jgi:hypothetical protein
VEVIFVDITQIGSLNTYLKQTKLKTQWNLKKETGNYSAHAKSLDEWLSDQTEAAQSYAAYTASDSSSNEDTKLQSIRQKIYNGSSLTAEEKDYLQKKDAATYAKVQAMEKEQKSYEAELRRCKTKDDVARVKMAHMSSALSELKAAKGDLGAVMLVNAKVRGITRITQKFVQKGYYNDLPTDVEKAEAEKEEQEASTVQEKRQEPAVEQTAEQSVEKTEAKTDTSSKVDDTAKEVKVETEQESPEVQKVRRAKAVAYTHWVDLEQETTASVADSGVQLDTKA